MDSATHQMMKIMMMSSTKKNMMTMRTRITITRMKTTITMRMIMTKMTRMMRMMRTLRTADHQTDAAIAMEGLLHPALVPEKVALRDEVQMVHAADLPARHADRIIPGVAQIAQEGEDQEIQVEVDQTAPVEVLQAPGGDQGTPHPARVLPLTARVQVPNADLPQ